MNKLNVHPFNNKIETGLRILTILNSTYPKSYDLQSIVYLDYMAVHSGDINKSITSLHPAVSNRKGELLIRREVIFSSLELFIEKGLIDRLYSENGIEYKASENSTTFLDSLNELYSIELQNRSSWINSYIKDLSPELLQKQMINFIKNEG
ncbi:ABC-three component system middle component 2 [Flavobacterium koreense]